MLSIVVSAHIGEENIGRRQSIRGEGTVGTVCGDRV